MQVYFIRHGETDWNRQRRTQGFSDPALNETGREQAERIARFLAGEPLVAVYSSPLRRALGTARAIAACHGLPVCLDPDLREQNQGVLEGLSLEEMRQRYPEVVAAWAENAAALTLPGGESLGEVQERAWRALQKIREKHAPGPVAVVSHNLAILSLLCRSLGLPLPLFRRLRQSVGAVSLVELADNRNRLLLFNHTCHLKVPLLAAGVPPKIP